jgi:exopolyphosphatase/guanosine-5'-triphosphate,3'-diphosphate pyrophosphatase
MVGPSMSSAPVAAVDIGTNSVRLLISGVGVEIRRSAVTGLGKGMALTGRLSADGRSATLEVLSGYRRLMDEAGVATARAVATSASRDAADGPEFVAEMAGVLGVEPEIIAGAEEAALSYAGATAGLEGEDWVVVDIGGGSTEVIDGTGGASFDVGSVRVTDRFFAERPVPAPRLTAARAWARASLEAEARGMPVVGVAGTWTSLASLEWCLQPYADAAVHHTELSAAAVEGWVDHLAMLPIEETAALPGLDPARAPVILGGAVVAAACLEVLGVDHVLISTHDLLDGVVEGLRS